MRLSKLKDWFYLSDAAKEISNSLGLDIKALDIIQAVIERKLDLSCYVSAHPVVAEGLTTELQSPIAREKVEAITGVYKIVIEHNENILAGSNIKDEWLLRMIKGQEENDGFINNGFLLEDGNGNRWRALTYESGAIGVVAIGGNSGVKKLADGYYLRRHMPKTDDLVIQKKHLYKLIQSLDCPMAIQEDKKLSWRDLLIKPPKTESDKFNDVCAAIDMFISKHNRLPTNHREVFEYLKGIYGVLAREVTLPSGKMSLDNFRSNYNRWTGKSS